MLHLNRYYQDLYRQTDDPEVKKYLAEKLVQAENVLFALRQRESTMLRCARFVAAGQQAFFRDGPRALRPMYMTEAAQALDVHLSTVSRAVKDKYLQCRQGVFPLSYFFSAPAPDGSDVSRRAVLLQLRELIPCRMKSCGACWSRRAVFCPGAPWPSTGRSWAFPARQAVESNGISLFFQAAAGSHSAPRCCFHLWEWDWITSAARCTCP